jgi:hypothetical protein
VTEEEATREIERATRKTDRTHAGRVRAALEKKAVWSVSMRGSGEKKSIDFVTGA